MNQNYWLTEQLNAQRSRELQKQAEQERLAKVAQNEPAKAEGRNLLNLSLKKQDENKRER